MGPTHYDGHSSGAQRIADAVRFGYHSGHRSDAHQTHVLLTDKAHEFLLAHGLCIAVNQ